MRSVLRDVARRKEKIMKRHRAAALALVMTLSSMTPAASVYALDYTGTLGNDATFETMGEVQQNESSVMEKLNGTKYMAHPVMAAYPADTTFVYRSADMYGHDGAVRMNTNLVVYTDQSFKDKDEAQAYLKKMGVLDIVDQVRGSVILVTPSDPENGFGAADQKYYYDLQTAVFSLGASQQDGDDRITYADGHYYGGYGYYYVIGVDGGATFLNNYIAGNLDYVSRIAGMLLVNGTMERFSKVASSVPVYLVNASDDAVSKYKEANTTDALLEEKDRTVAYDQEYPARRVISRQTDEISLDTLVKDAYQTLFSKSYRGEELKPGTNSASTPYQGYTGDQAPYSLHVRNAMADGKTADGIEMTEVKDDRFKDIQTEDGEYLQTWFEYVPEEVTEGKVADGTVPMFLILHGGGDDPRQYVEGQGFIELAGEKRFIMVAPDKSMLHANDKDGHSVLDRCLPELVKYMEDKYPQIDKSRVYVNGYSMGSLATCLAMYGDPGLFAAAFPQAGIAGAAPTQEQMEKFKDLDLPVAISTSEYDAALNVDPVTHNLVPDFYNLISDFCQMNEIGALPEADYEKYPLSGFQADIYEETTMNDEYLRHTWTFLNSDKVPMVELDYIDDIAHALYPEYAKMVWNFVKHYSRDQETKKVVYNPYAE